MPSQLMLPKNKTIAPKWFRQAVQARRQERMVQVRGATIHYLRWGKPGKPGLLFIHGGFAHAHWWDFIAPSFAKEYCAAAIDLGGMGDSSHRETYSAEIFAEEVMSVCAHAEFGNKPVVIGHSFGGLVALKTGALYGRELSGVVLVDFPLRPPEVQKEHEAKRPPWIRPKEIYPQKKAALKRFRLIPPQPCDNEFILKYIAGHSLAKVDGGWNWKFDDKMFDNFDSGNIAAELNSVTCCLAVIYGGRSALFPASIVEYMNRILPQQGRIVCFPEAHHHLFLEQPREFVLALRSLLKDWAVGEGVCSSRNFGKAVAQEAT
jgi:pimeloyl-ACP methyl ester carboxylesterase